MGIDELGVCSSAMAATLLVWFAAFHRGNAPHRALSERDGTAGDLRVLAGMVWALEIRRRASSKRMISTIAAA